MNMHDIKEFLLWCVGINYAMLLYWVAIFFFAHDRLYRLLSRWFKLSIETFDALNFAGMTVYKLGIILFNLVPLVALYLV
jgi:hypothetical protein